MVRAVRSVFSEEKKLSIAALSQQLPERLMLQARPWSARSCWNGSLVNWLPRSESCNTTQLQACLASTKLHFVRAGGSLPD